MKGFEVNYIPATHEQKESRYGYGMVFVICVGYLYVWMPNSIDGAQCRISRFMLPLHKIIAIKIINVYQLILSIRLGLDIYSIFILDVDPETN